MASKPIPRVVITRAVPIAETLVCINSINKSREFSMMKKKSKPLVPKKKQEKQKIYVAKTKLDITGVSPTNEVSSGRKGA
jgi:hypothetical protein